MLLGYLQKEPFPCRTEGSKVHNLRFLADMNISPLTVAHLKDRRWDILRVSEVMDQSTKDLVILGYAREYDKILPKILIPGTVYLILGIFSRWL